MVKATWQNFARCLTPVVLEQKLVQWAIGRILKRSRALQIAHANILGVPNPGCNADTDAMQVLILLRAMQEEAMEAVFCFEDRKQWKLKGKDSLAKAKAEGLELELCDILLFWLAVVNWAGLSDTIIESAYEKHRFNLTRPDHALSEKTS